MFSIKKKVRRERILRIVARKRVIYECECECVCERIAIKKKSNRINKIIRF